MIQPNAQISAGILARSLNHGIDESISRISRTEWDENHISFSLVKVIRDVLTMAGNLETGPGKDPVRIQAEAYKVTGKMEQTHGDIVVAIHNLDFGLITPHDPALPMPQALDQAGRSS